MDKTLLKAYIRTIVEEEVKRLLPELLNEAVGQIKQATVHPGGMHPAPQQSPNMDRGRLAELMGLSYDGETLAAGGVNPMSGATRAAPGTGAPEVVSAINRDYSELMKALKLS